MILFTSLRNKFFQTNSLVKRGFLLYLLFISCYAFAQQNPKSITSSLKEVIQNKKGVIKIYYTDSEGFISKSDTGLSGIEYEIMLSFIDFVQKKYKAKISYEFAEVKEFSELYEKGKKGKSGEFFAASFSITPQRLKEVKFSPAYMPDIEIMICSENLPVLYDTASFAKKFADARGVVVKNSTYEDNLLQIKAKYLPDLKIEYVKYYDDIRDRIAKEKNLFSYSQLASYLLMKQKGISFKRQNIFKIQKIGQGIIYSKQSDWEEPVNEFFNSEEFKILIKQLVRKYLGDDIKDLVSDLKGTKNTESQDEIMLLTKEKELQLMDIHKKELEIIRKNNLIFYSVVGLVLFSMLVFVLINRYQLKQKSNRLLLAKNIKIEEQRAELISQTEELVMQKEQIQEQSNLIIENHEQLKDASKKVIDSIRAAKTIQFALLPFESRLKKNLGEHFIIYHPKDIVSGDFYWVNEIEGKVFVALVDCTGHGVPGAFMTMIAYAFLNEIIIEKKISDPALILERLDQQLIYAFQYETDSVSSLGMDISICAIQKNISFPVDITFAGAKQSVYLYRYESKTLEKFRGIRRSLTCKAQQGNLNNFTNHSFKAQRGDILYLTTDGLMDIPNPKRRNFGPLRFQNMLSENAHLPINQQKEVYLQMMTDFQQDQEQRDDIGLMGFEFGDSFLI